MHKIGIRFILFFTTLIALIGCSSFNNEAPFDTHPSHRTILVYMLANNNLGRDYQYDEMNIADMGEAMASLNPDGRLLIFHAGYNATPYLMELRKSKKNQYETITIKQYEGITPTDSSALRRILTDVRQIAHAQDYGLIMWSHATNWLPNNRFYSPGRNAAPTSFGREGNEGLTMNIDEMSGVLNDFHHSFILFDACLMGSVEVAYQLRNACDYIIASPTETLGDGYPYKDILPYLFEYEIDYTQVCQQYYNMYIASSNPAGTISLIQTDHMEDLSYCCQGIIKHNNHNNIETRLLQYYDCKSPHLFYDLYDYMAQMGDEVELQYLQETMEKVIPYKAASRAFLNIVIKRYSGLSSYIPGCSNDTTTDNYYKKLDWYNKVYNQNN